MSDSNSFTIWERVEGELTTPLATIFFPLDHAVSDSREIWNLFGSFNCKAGEYDDCIEAGGKMLVARYKIDDAPPLEPDRVTVHHLFPAQIFKDEMEGGSQ